MVQNTFVLDLHKIATIKNEELTRGDLYRDLTLQKSRDPEKTFAYVREIKAINVEADSEEKLNGTAIEISNP